MAYTPKPDGRTAREVNDNVRADINRALDLLMALAGEHDPVKMQRTLRLVEPLLRGALNGSWQIENFYARKAKRGSYKKRDAYNGKDSVTEK